MIEGKRDQKEEGSKDKKISFPFFMGDMKENITPNINKQSKPSKEQIINQAFNEGLDGKQLKNRVKELRVKACGEQPKRWKWQ